MNQETSETIQRKPINKGLVISLLVLVGLLFGLWLWLTPTGFWAKLNAVGYSVCHQMTERSFVLGEHQSPLCARCAGMYLGALVTVIAHWFWGRQGKLPPLWINILLGLGFLAFAMDGLNSAINFLPFMPSLYQTTNLTRLITGTMVGLGIGSILMPIFNQTVWSNWTSNSAFDKAYRFPLIVAILSLVGVAVYSQKPIFFYPFNILMSLSVLLILWLIHSTLASFILRRSNQASHWRDLFLPGLLGLAMMMVQIGLISLARYLMTGTWAPILF